MPVAPGVNALVLSLLLGTQFFTDSCATPCTTLAANEGSNEVRPLEGARCAAGTALKHDLLWAPPVNPAKVLYFLGFVVLWDALDDLHTITSFLLIQKMPSKKKVVKGEEELTPTLQGGLPLFTELPSNECSRKLGFRRCRFSETQKVRGHKKRAGV